MNFDLIKSYYDLGLFTETDLDMFISIGWITEKQKKEITEAH